MIRCVKSCVALSFVLSHGMNNVFKSEEASLIEHSDDNKSNDSLNSISCSFLFNNSDKTKEICDILDHIRVDVDVVKNCRDSFKLRFFLKDMDITELLKLNPNDFELCFLGVNDKHVSGNILTWEKKEICSNQTLSSIKRGFLSDISDDPYSISLKVKDVDKLKPLKIKIIYKNINGARDIFAKYNDNPVIDFKKILFSEKYDKLFDSIEGKCFCDVVKNNSDGLKICFPKNNELLNSNLGNYLGICIEDEKGNAVKDVVMTNWNKDINVVNGMMLGEIKKGFLTVFKENKYDSKPDPFSISLRITNDQFSKIRIKIIYDDRSFYVKHGDSDLIDLARIGVRKCQQMSDEDFKKVVGDVFSKGITISKLSKLSKKAVKIQFSNDNRLLDSVKRNNFKIYFLDKDGNSIDGIFACFNDDSRKISSGSAITDIKKTFLIYRKEYSSDLLYSFSMLLPANVKQDFVKIKICYGDLSCFVKYKNSELIKISDLK